MSLAVALKSLLALTGLWFAVYYLWRDYRVDAFRDHVFAIRDRMFLYAAQGNISFENPAYALLRDRMNMMLRHGHEFSMTRLLLVIAKQPVTPTPKTFVKWQEAVDELPKPISEKMKEFNLVFVVALVQHVIFYSFFRYMFIRPLMPLLNQFKVREVVDKPKVVRTFEQLETETAAQEARLKLKVQTQGVAA